MAIARTLSPFSTAWRESQAVAYTWLVESVALRIHWAFRAFTLDGVTWEPRLWSISSIEESIPPGGGLAPVQTCTVEVVQTAGGSSLRTLWDEYGRLEGADLSIALLPDGESYANRIRKFTGLIDHVAYQVGVTDSGGLGTVVAVSRELHRDIEVPATVLTRALYPALPDQLQGARLPLIYGAGSVLRVAPALLIDPAHVTYRVAEHALGAMGTTYAVLGADQVQLLTEAATAISIAGEALLTLARPVTATRFGIAGQTQALTHVVGVTNPSAAVDGNPASLATLRTPGLNRDLDGEGRLAVQIMSPHPDAANTVLLTLTNHRRAPGAATTLTAEVLLRSRHVHTGLIERDDLFHAGPYRHSSNPRTTVLTVTPLVLGALSALEVEFRVINEGGVGTSAETWDLGELSAMLYYQAETLFTPVYLSHPWEGRTDPDGTLTGTPGTVVRQAASVLQSVVTQVLGLEVQDASFAAVKLRLATYLDGPYLFDFGLGSGGWAHDHLAAAALLDALAFQAGCYLFPAGDGTTALARVQAVRTPQLALTLANATVLEVEFGQLARIHSTYEVHYAWSVTLRQYTKVALATPGLCNHPILTIAHDLLLKCSDAQDRYGPQDPLRVEAWAIQDDATAFTLLQRLVEYFWTQHLTVVCETTFVGIHLEVGDSVTISHPEFPAAAQDGLFELVRITTIPEVPDSRPMPLRLVGQVQTRRTFDYFAIKDQDGVDLVLVDYPRQHAGLEPDPADHCDAHGGESGAESDSLLASDGGKPGDASGTAGSVPVVGHPAHGAAVGGAAGPARVGECAAPDGGAARGSTLPRAHGPHRGAGCAPDAPATGGRVRWESRPAGPRHGAAGG